MSEDASQVGESQSNAAESHMSAIAGLRGVVRLQHCLSRHGLCTGDRPNGRPVCPHFDFCNDPCRATPAEVHLRNCALRDCNEEVGRLEAMVFKDDETTWRQEAETREEEVRQFEARVAALERRANRLNWERNDLAFDICGVPDEQRPPGRALAPGDVHLVLDGVQKRYLAAHPDAEEDL